MSSRCAWPILSLLVDHAEFLCRSVTGANVFRELMLASHILGGSSVRYVTEHPMKVETTSFPFWMSVKPFTAGASEYRPLCGFLKLRQSTQRRSDASNDDDDLTVHRHHAPGPKFPNILFINSSKSPSIHWVLYYTPVINSITLSSRPVHLAGRRYRQIHKISVVKCLSIEDRNNRKGGGGGGGGMTAMGHCS